MQNRIFAKACAVHPTVLEALAKWKETSRYAGPQDWVFASRRHRGRKPIWGQAILRRYIRPVARRVGIQKRFGWHTFRHTFSTLLRSVGTEFKVMQELLRHSSLRSTLDVYTQAISPAKPLNTSASFVPYLSCFLDWGQRMRTWPVQLAAHTAKGRLGVNWPGLCILRSASPCIPPGFVIY